MATEQRGRGRARRVWGSGLAAGLVGAVAMGLVAMIVAAASGKGFFVPMKLVAGTFMGPAAMTAGASAVVLGAVTHLVVGSFFGVIFAAIMAEDAAPGLRFAASLVYGVAIFIVMTIFILPLIDQTMAGHIDVIWFLVYHLVYGFSLSLVVPAVRAGRRSRIGGPQHA